MKKLLIYKIEIAVEPETASPALILTALEKFGKAKIVGSSMRKQEA
jgi:hypothetical protein